MTSVSPRIRDLGVAPGFLPTGPFNAITDVPGVSVGHVSLRGEGVCTGVTSILHGPREELWLRACSERLWTGGGSRLAE